MNYSSGKPSLFCTLLASAQKQNLICLFANVEATLNYAFAEKLGVDMQKLLVLDCDFAKEYLNAIEKAVMEKAVDVIILDSVEALEPIAEKESDYDQALMGLRARMLSRFFRKIIPSLKKTKIVLVFVNQSRRDFVTQMEFTPGGRALKFYSSLRLQLKKTFGLKSGEKLIGYEIVAKVEKNKCANPGGAVELKFFFDSGFSVEADLLENGLAKGVLKKEGITLYFGEIKVGVGMAKAREFLKANQEIMEQIAALSQ